MESTRRRISLSTWILLGLLLGAVAGVGLNLAFAPELGAEKSETFAAIEGVADRLVRPFGDLFLRLLFMVVVPVVFCSLFLGVAGLGTVQRLGRLGGRTLLWFCGTGLLAAGTGTALVLLLAPGRRMDAAVAAQVQAQYVAAAQAKVEQSQAAKGWLQVLVDLVPTNVVGAAASNQGLLSLIVFALLLGAASIRVGPERTRALRELLEGVYALCLVILDWTMRLAPLGVACLIFHAAVTLGLPLMQLVGWYFATVMAGLLLLQFGVLPALAWGFAGVAPGRFLSACRGLFVTAFSTSSSNATVPATMRTAEDEFGVPPEVAGFVVPLGATMNMNGTALFLCVVVLFLAQVAGVALGPADYAVVLGMALLVAIGAAGVPGGSLPLLALVLAQVGVPPELLALILGVDRVVDMTRTVPNITGDLICSLWLARR
ncbi:MAG: dicarboxylate/amino acid:cation symporter [Planctomycetes bacterium]|nr:dicarboxylate/amino acid:cation symporter [Planctomycetota bacterium]